MCPFTLSAILSFFLSSIIQKGGFCHEFVLFASSHSLKFVVRSWTNHLLLQQIFRSYGPNSCNFRPSFIHSFLHPFLPSSIPSFIHSFLPSFIHSSIHSSLDLSFISGVIHSIMFFPAMLSCQSGISSPRFLQAIFFLWPLQFLETSAPARPGTMW